MKMENQGTGTPPARPPPPTASGPPPPYGDPLVGPCPGNQPGMPGQCDAPPPYAPAPYEGGYPTAAGYMPPGPPQGYAQGPPPQGFHLNSPPQLYPDISQLPQPEAVPIDPRGPQPSFGPNVAPPVVPPSPTASSRVPVRPAPCPPVHVPSAPSSGLDQPPWWAALRDGEAPPSCVISWKGGDGLKLYFIQEEGHVVSPKKPLGLTVYKKIKGRGDVVEESLLGMIEVVGCWRLRLHGKDSFCLHTFNDTYIFLDDSTCPSKSGRIVILELPQDVSKTMRSDLLALLQEMTDLREEQEGVVDKITTNVGAVYEDITKKINLAVKDVVPGAHKSTKWIRKGTGSLVRMGGNLVSKGLHMIADHAPASQPEKEEESPIHSALLEGLRKFQRDLENKMITYVD
ncbi:uncharacterized protein LOC135217155 isoform X3 [Macrobrachium nipponense]|uniref:uncharacterized protein LOC135217155 isoform X3 n=1 Tax=Macrobrachium nipponense TaxID=159736 RepID=UPI0030C84951